MEWLLAPTSSLLVMILVVPLLVVVGAAIALVAGHALPGGLSLSRVAFDCPFSKQRATVEFLNAEGGERPTDVLTCSVFEKPYHVRCEKRCLEMMETGWAASALMPRFAMLADGVTYRGAASRAGKAPDSPSDGGMTRAA